ncbi:WLM domain [Fragilaria crotonensis]|nr:WLM domain [Fragilaria crotonensis]
MTANEDTDDTGKLIVSFRGQKIELSASPYLTVGQVKSTVASAADGSSSLSPTNVKLIFKGKVLTDDEDRIIDTLGDKPAKAYRLLATGLSVSEQAEIQQQFEQGIKNAPRIRDDLTNQGRQDMIHRRNLGKAVLQRAAAKSNGAGGLKKYGFGAIETLPNLPDASKARDILTTLANDPGVLAVMAKHQWNVGCLAELYPEGKVGQSAVCVMGLNQNKGQKILLRIRTDDLRGFRKILSIRKVLFHELAHNVHSDHNQEFFQLMRQVERECNEMDWTQGSGTSALETEQAYVTGSYRLGGNASNKNESARELAARAAIQRLTAEEQEIYDNCGCGRESKFLPPPGGPAPS